jgi:hypothetical protein
MGWVRPDGNAWPAGSRIIHDGQTQYYCEMLDCGSIVRKNTANLDKTPTKGQSFGGLGILAPSH